MARAFTNATRPLTLPETGFVRLNHLLKLIPVSDATIRRWVEAGIFPKPVKLGLQMHGWRVEDVRSWMAAREEVEA